MYTYPPAAPSYSGDALTIHRLLQSPALVAKRLQTLVQQRYIADFLLKERLEVAGGAITWESGEPLGTAENPRAVAPGSESPLVTLGNGVPSLAKTTKWAQGTHIYDEAIKRQRMSPVNRAMTRLGNQNVSYIDQVAMSVIGTAVTQSVGATANWVTTATAEQILTQALNVRAQLVALDLGIDPDVVVLSDVVHAAVLAKFIAAGYLPREGTDTAIVTGAFPNIGGMTWVATNHGLATTALVADTDLLGGMADEDLQSPGYARAGEAGQAGVEVLTERLTGGRDGWFMNARRVTVPVVLEPLAGYKITGVSA